jgi:predicted aldo/keto reductase-like oxidoreductase
MKYRKFGKLDWEVSALGFGVMRLPTTDGDPAHIDKPEAIRMIRYAIDQGMNYLDTAYMYHSDQSESLVAEVLKDGYRQKVRVATKMPVSMVEAPEDFDRFFNEQLRRLQDDKVDFYLLHGLNAPVWKKSLDFGIIPWAEEQMTLGRIDRFGFSFHDDYQVFKDIVDAYDNWTFCQLQYNYMDVDFQAGRRGLEYAAANGLAVVVMEPLRGGMLAKEPPPAVAEVWGDNALQQRSRVEWALQWIWDQPEVSLILSGMSTMAQVEENCSFADRSAPGSLTADELALVGRVREAYQGLIPVPCTACGYCLPCSSGVEIPRIFQVLNDATMYGDMEMGKLRYQGHLGLKAEECADRCIECGECLELCPQGIPIIDWLKEAHARLKLEQ